MEFELNEPVCVAFSRTKEEISKNVTLPYFNPNSSTTLQTDASKKGTRRCTSTKFQTSNVCIKGIDWKSEELSELGKRMFSNNLGHGKVPLLSI